MFKSYCLIVPYCSVILKNTASSPCQLTLNISVNYRMLSLLWNPFSRPCWPQPTLPAWGSCIPGSEPPGIGLLFIETGADAASSAINRSITRIGTTCVTVSCWKHHRNGQCLGDAERREMKRQQAAAAAVV